jgi:hypothetical protein
MSQTMLNLFRIVQMKNPVYSSVIIRERFSSLRFMKLGEVEYAPLLPPL